MADATLPTHHAERRAAVIEDVEFMLDTHRGTHEISTRIGLPERTLGRTLHRWGRHDLARTFERVAA